MSKPYGLTTPCKLCPFRTDVHPYILPERVREIERSLERAEFPCHKTTSRDDECDDGLYIRTGREVHCAGALILMIKEDRSSQMMRIAHRLGMFDPAALDMAAPVYASFDEMHEAHERAVSPPRTSSRRRR